MAIADVITSREALRREVLDDIVGRCQIAAVSIEGGALDGVEVVSMGTLRDQVTAALLVDLPSPSEKFAEVITPAVVTVSAVCPECRVPSAIPVRLSPQLTVTNDGAELAVKAKSKPRVHLCGQLTLPEGGDQTSFELEDVVGELCREPINLPDAPDDATCILPGGHEGDHTAALAVEPCPFPKCVRAADHDGEHNIACGFEIPNGFPCTKPAGHVEAGDDVHDDVPF